MIVINIKNIEELILRNSKIKEFLPDLRHIFDQWLLSVRIPFLRTTKLKSSIDLLNSLNSNHIKLLEDYFQDTIILDRLDYHIVKNVNLNLDSIKSKDLDFDFGQFAISRNADQLYISFWR